jgi:hypothetical protein
MTLLGALWSSLKPFIGARLGRRLCKDSGAFSYEPVSFAFASGRKRLLAARCSTEPEDYVAGVQVLGLRAASTTSRITAVARSRWSWRNVVPAPGGDGLLRGGDEFGEILVKRG